MAAMKADLADLEAKGLLVVVAGHREGEDTEGETDLRVRDAILLPGRWSALDEHLDDPDVVVLDSPDAVRRQTVPLGAGARRALAVLVGMVAARGDGRDPRRDRRVAR